MVSEDPRPARNTLSWLGGTSRRCAEPGRVSLSRFGGAPPTRVSQATRRRTNVQNSWRKYQMRKGCNGSQGLLPTSSGRSRRRNGQWPDSEIVTGSTRRSIRSLPGRSQTEWSQVVPRAGLKVLLAEDRSLLCWATPKLDEEAPRPLVLVVCELFFLLYHTRMKPI